MAATFTLSVFELVVLLVGAIILGLTDAERTELSIRTIGATDVPKAARTRRRKHQARDRGARSAPRIARAR